MGTRPHSMCVCVSFMPHVTYIIAGKVFDNYLFNFPTCLQIWAHQSSSCLVILVGMTYILYKTRQYYAISNGFYPTIVPKKIRKHNNQTPNTFTGVEDWIIQIFKGWDLTSDFGFIINSVYEGRQRHFVHCISLWNI